jgi:hypothetical protein
MAKPLEIYRQPALLGGWETPARELTTDDYRRALLLKQLLEGQPKEPVSIFTRIRRWFQDPERGLNA